MKYLFLLISLCVLSCGKENFDPDQNPDIVGTWQVTEQYSDPGDGSGGFSEVDYYRTFTFLEDGTIISDRDMCFPLNGSEEEVDSRGSYDVSTGIITPDICAFTRDFWFELDGQVLTFNFFCFESCALRLRKLR